MDELESPMRIVDSFGKPKAAYSFSEFGSVKEKRGSYSQPFGYTGYQYDDTANLYFAQARYYDPTLGRFVSEDKVKGNIIQPDTINPYIYCINNPLRYIDRDGCKLFGVEYTYTEKDNFYDFSLETPWWSPIIVSDTVSESKQVCSKGEKGSIFTAYLHESSDIVSSSVGINLFSTINLDISLKKITLSATFGNFSMDFKIGVEETGFTISLKDGDVKDTFGIVMKLFDGKTFNFSLGLSYSRSETKDDTIITNTTDVGLNIWYIIGLIILIEYGEIPDIKQMMQPIPQTGTCVL